MTLGAQAEEAVAKKLKSQGYQILALNWKTRICEIDIVAKKDDIIYFTEVKYRSSSSQGSGFDYLTPKKLSQLKFAGRVWTQNQRWDGDWRILAAQVSGPDFSDIEVTEIT
ncbi:MAG: YraN family protein [Candidatus Saccharimonadales bacterium]